MLRSLLTLHRWEYTCSRLMFCCNFWGIFLACLISSFRILVWLLNEAGKVPQVVKWGRSGYSFLDFSENLHELWKVTLIYWSLTTMIEWLFDNNLFTVLAFTMEISNANDFRSEIISMATEDYNVQVTEYFLGRYNMLQVYYFVLCSLSLFCLSVWCCSLYSVYTYSPLTV